MKRFWLGLVTGVIAGLLIVELMPRAMAQQSGESSITLGGNPIVMTGDLTVSVAVDRVGEMPPIDGSTENISQVILTEEWIVLKQSTGRGSRIVIPRERTRYLVVQE